MKTLLKILLVSTGLLATGYAQNVNWKSLGEEQRNLIQFNAGYDYGATVQLGYARSFTVVRPVVVGLDYSSPMGDNMIDDFKVRLGAQIEVVEIGGFAATIRIVSNFRRYETQLVRIASFGSDFAVLAGYYTSSWYAAGECGFDKAVTSHLKHSDIMRANFPGIRDGWYVPTGGNYYYGIQGGKTIGGTLEISLRFGATDAQFEDENSPVPLYLQLCVGVKF